MRWLFRRQRAEHAEIVSRLEAERPRPDEDFVDDLAGRVRERARFRGMPARVALAATSAVIVLVAVALVGGTGQYASALGAVADLASATVTSSSTPTASSSSSSKKEYSEQRKLCKKEASAAYKSQKKTLEEQFKQESSDEGKKISDAEKAQLDQLKNDYEAAKQQCEEQFPKK